MGVWSVNPLKSTGTEQKMESGNFNRDSGNFSQKSGNVDRDSGNCNTVGKL